MYTKFLCFLGCFLIAAVGYVHATQLPMVTFEDLRSKAKVVLVGRVDSARIVDEEDSGQLELVVVPQRTYVGVVPESPKKIAIRVSGSSSPVRVGKAGLFFLSHHRQTDTYVESIPRMGAFERVNYFCGTEKHGGWEGAYTIVRHGEFLTEVPVDLLLTRLDCIPDLVNQSPPLSDSLLPDIR